MAQPPEAARVVGFGGFFFRALDPQALASWYVQNLGVSLSPTSYNEKPWMQGAGPTVFEPCSADTTFFDTDKQFMLNFRTKDLGALVAHLRANGVEVVVDETAYPNGHFAQLSDPEGNPIQLWQPAP
ncbi:MAG: VOC family protein [Pseudomonadota bacterium]